MKKKKEIDILKRKCLRCSHTWYKRTESEPISCPKCHSPYWNRKRVGGKPNE